MSGVRITIKLSPAKTAAAKRSLQRWVAGVRLDMIAHVRATGRDVETDAQNFAPVDTGVLESAFDRKEIPLETTVFNPTSYAIHQEYGPSPGNDRPWTFTPFFNPAIESNRGKFIRKARKILRARRRT